MRVPGKGSRLALLLLSAPTLVTALQNAQPAVMATCSTNDTQTAGASLFQKWSFVGGPNATSGYIQNAAGRVAPAFKPFCLSLDDCEPSLTVMYDCAPSTDCSNRSFAHYRWRMDSTGRIVSDLNGSLCLSVGANQASATPRVQPVWRG